VLILKKNSGAKGLCNIPSVLTVASKLIIFTFV
jgi:hypothetical protein